MSSLFRNTFYTSLAQGWQMLMALLLFKLAATFLQGPGFGKYSVATTIMYFVLMFDDLGLSTLTTREIARDKNKAQRFLGVVLGLKTVLILISLLFVFLFTSLTHYDPETDAAIWIFTFCGLAYSFAFQGYAVFRAYERMELETAITVLEKTVSTVFGILVLALGMGIIAFSWMFALASLVALTASMWILQKRFLRLRPVFHMGEFRKALSSSIAFGIAMFITFTYDRVDILLLSTMKDMGAAGLYGAAHKLLSFTGLVPTIFATAFFPKFSIHANDPQELSRIFTTGFKYLMMLAVPMIPAVFILSKPLMLFFSTAEFLEASGALCIMAVTSGILFINIFLASLYGATNHQKRILVFEVVGLCMNVAGNWMLIPRYSYMGSAVATVITEGIVVVLAMTWSLKHIAKITEYSFWGKIVLATGGMSIFLLFFRNGYLPGNVAGGAAVYFFLLFVTRAVDAQQLKRNLAELRARKG